MADILNQGRLGGFQAFPLAGLSGPPVSVDFGFPRLPASPSVTLRAAWSGWQQMADGSVKVTAPDGQVKTLFDAAGNIAQAAGIAQNLASALGPAVASLSSITGAFAQVAAFAGPFGAAVAAGAPVLEMALRLFADAPERPLPSMNGVNASTFANTPYLDDASAQQSQRDRLAELAGRLVRDPEGISGKAGADKDTVRADALSRLSAVARARAIQGVDPSRNRALCIALAQVNPELAAQWVPPKNLPYLMALINYGTPRAALRDALASLGVLLSAEAAEAVSYDEPYWSWGEGRVRVPGRTSPPLPRRCGRPGRIRFRERYTGWIGESGHSGGHDAQRLCENSVELYARFLANRMLPIVRLPTEGAAGANNATGRKEVVYPIPEEVARDEMDWGRNHPMRIYTAVAGGEFIFGFPADNRTGAEGERDPDINNDTVRPLPSVPDAIRLCFQIAKTARAVEGGGRRTLWDIQNDEIRAVEKENQAAIDAAQKRRALARAIAGAADQQKNTAAAAVARAVRRRLEKEAREAEQRLREQQAKARKAHDASKGEQRKEIGGTGLSPLAKALLAAAGAAALFR